MGVVSVELNAGEKPQSFEFQPSAQNLQVTRVHPRVIGSGPYSFNKMERFE